MIASQIFFFLKNKFKAIKSIIAILNNVLLLNGQFALLLLPDL